MLALNKIHNNPATSTYLLEQSAHVTAAFDIPANSTNGENLVVTNLNSSNFA
jgi:hypothetical protein